MKFSNIFKYKDISSDDIYQTITLLRDFSSLKKNDKFEEAIVLLEGKNPSIIFYRDDGYGEYEEIEILVNVTIEPKAK